MSHSILDLQPPPTHHRLAYGPGKYQFGDLRVPKKSGPHPIAVAVHGGFWGPHQDLAYLGHLCKALLSHGVATWNIEYRRVGQEGGGWPGTLQDVASAADHLRVLASEYDLDLGRTGAFGHSAGGHLALWLAARSRISAGSPVGSVDPLPLRAAISINGVANLRHGWDLDLGPNVVAPFLGGTPVDVPDRYASASPAELVPLGVPQVLVHGTEDTVVPIGMSEAYCRAATEAGDMVVLVSMPGAGHFEPVDPRIAAGRKTMAIIANALNGIFPSPELGKR